MCTAAKQGQARRQERPREDTARCSAEAMPGLGGTGSSVLWVVWPPSPALE